MDSSKIFTLLLSELVKYVEEHPQVLENVMQALFAWVEQELIAAVAAKTSTPAA